MAWAYRKREARKREEQRWQAFLDMAQQWHSAQTARAFLRTLENLLGEDLGPFGERSPVEWLAWVRDRLKEYDPLDEGSDAVWQALAKI